MRLLLLQHLRAALPDDALRGLGKAREQPGQRHLDAYRVLEHRDRAGRVLRHRGDAEVEPVALPALVIEADRPGEFALGAVEPASDPAQRLVLAEAVRYRDGERLGHGGLPACLI